MDTEEVRKYWNAFVHLEENNLRTLMEILREIMHGITVVSVTS